MLPVKICAAAVISAILLFTSYPSADAIMRELPLPQPLKSCYEKAQNYTCQNFVGGKYCWYCEAPLRAMLSGASQAMTPSQARYVESLYQAVESRAYRPGREKRQATPPRPRCIRKECRVLTDQERVRLFAAFNALKTDRSVAPSLYDAISAYHTGVTNFIAHGGPGFPGWHRVYLALVEEALRQKDPNACLCYWDSSLDASLANPTRSNAWTDTFFGDSQGAVTSGPFANWITRNNVPLTRSVGVDGQLMTRRIIEDILSRNTYEETLLADGNPRYNLEFHHGGPHIFVGGDMERLETAANDPVFFLHHTFIDYIWELIRTKLRRLGRNPERYPVSPNIDPLHRPDTLTGFGNITHVDGYQEVWKDSFDYQPSPTCSRTRPNCGSRYLSCDLARAICVPVIPRNTPTPTTPRPIRSPRATVNLGSPFSSFTASSTSYDPFSGLDPGASAEPVDDLGEDGSCSDPKPQAYQNNFCVDGSCDVNQWVWLPVRIVAQRPPEMTVYKSYPVQNNQIYTASDIYQPSAYSDTSRYIKPDTPKPLPYENCAVKDGVGKIFVSSMGLSYDGYYKESAIVDQRLATSFAVAYVAVKDPNHGKSEVVLRAHDQCGRICHTACLVPGSNPPRYTKCSGVVQVTSETPRMYGQTYAEATFMTYDYASDAFCPNVNLNDFFVTFYCNYVDYLPWIDRPAQTFPGPSPTLNPYSLPTLHNQCRVASNCVINQPCYVDPRGQGRTCSDYTQAFICVDNCEQYTVCNYGTFWLRQCPTGMYFDERVGQCVRGSCRPTTGSGYSITGRPTHWPEDRQQGFSYGK